MECTKCTPFFSAVSQLLHAVLVGLDHLLDHLAADAAGLARGQIAVVTLLQVDADLSRCTCSIKQR